MNRVTLSVLAVSNGDLPSVEVRFANGLNVISGVENRGKTYAVSCLDYLFGGKNPPEPNPESRGYTTATLYYVINGATRGVVRRHFETGVAETSPNHPVDEDLPQSAWKRLAKRHSSRKESLSSYWLDVFDVPRTQLRRNLSGQSKALTIRFVAHLFLVDELRIMDKRSPALSSQVVSHTADADALAVMLNARKNEPEANVQTATVPERRAGVRAYLERELTRLNSLIEGITVDGLPSDGNEQEEIAKRAESFSAAAEGANRELRAILGRLEDAQSSLVRARSQMQASAEIVSRLRLLNSFYESDLRRLVAVAETVHYLEQLKEVPCPTCLQPFPVPHDGVETPLSPAALQDIAKGANVEAIKIRSLRLDLGETVGQAERDAQAAAQSEQFWVDALANLRNAATAQNRRVAEANKALTQVFDTLTELANRRSLKQRREELNTQLQTSAGSTDDTDEIGSQFESGPVDGLCECIQLLLVAWKWDYTATPLTVAFDYRSMDLVISGEPRSSFGKAARALLSSAFLIGLMNYCLANNLPHPGFVILDSPLTTKKERASGDNGQVSDDIVTAFFEDLATQYSDRQVIIVDNKEPPVHLAGTINHIRFGDDAGATRRGLFSVANS